MTVTKNAFVEDLKHNVRDMLRDTMTDPESGSRNAEDFFIFADPPNTDLGSAGHQPPTIIITTEDADSRYLGASEIGTASEKNAVLQFRCIARTHANLNSLVSGVGEKLVENNRASGTWANPTTGADQSYDLGNVDLDENIFHRDRPLEALDHDFRETVMEWSYNGVYAS